MAGYLTTHVLDTARGCPAAGMRISLYKLSGAGRELVCMVETNADGRTDEQVLPADQFEKGIYELLFHAGDYLRETGTAGEEPLFLDTIPIRFGLSQDDHYHVPLLISPYGYSTYRGS